jgi:hypothetical protein
VAGPTGPTGPTGSQGGQGNPGNQGPQGNPGNNGNNGNIGPTGPQGAQGNPGNQGNQGNPGNPGNQGNVGPQGPQGPSWNTDQNAQLNQGGTPTFSNVYATSDERLKTDIRVIENALEKVMQIRGVLFTRINNGEADAGVLAQELQAVIPELVRIDDEGFLSVSYGNIAGLLIEAIKELKHELDEVKKKLP